MILFNEYCFMLYWIAFLAIFLKAESVMEPVNIFDRKEYRIKTLVAVVAFFPIFYTAAFGDIFQDVGGYLKSFVTINASWSDIKEVFITRPKGYGYIALVMLIKMIFGYSTTWYRIVIASIQSIPIIYIFKKYSSNFYLSVFMFVATAYNISWMMNGLRQGVAISIALWAFPFVLKKKYIKALVIIGIAAMCHSTALVLVPIIFLIKGRALDKRTIYGVAIGLVALFVLFRTGIIASMFEGSDYETAVNSLSISMEKGTGVPRVLVNCVPAALCIWGKQKLREIDDPVVNVCANISIITAGIFLISMVTDGVMIGRLPGYVSIYNMVLLPFLVEYLFSEEMSKIVKQIMVIMYIIYYYFQMHMVNGLI